MEAEYQGLNHLQHKIMTTQRNITQRTGLSIGAVNILIKKMVRMRYILTPRGVKEKIRRNYQFVRSSCYQISKNTSAVEAHISDKQTKNIPAMTHTTAGFITS